MYQDLKTEHEMRQPLHMLSKGPWKKGQQKLVQEKEQKW